jgi:hypothetical protein
MWRFGILAPMRRPVAVLALAALAGGTWATSATAQEDGVYFDDPDSPGGKEYSIPHERTRRESGAPGGGGRAGGGGSEGETPRFGVGIEPDDGASGGGGSSGDSEEGSGGSGGKSSGGSGSGDTAGDGGAAADAASRGSGDVEYQATSSSDTQPEVTVSAIALGVLLAGGGLGLFLRRSRRDATE